MNQSRKWLATFASCAIALLAFPAAAQPQSRAPQLPTLNIDRDQTSVSGISSGGYMAVQFHVAHSASVKGAGVLAAGPYYCAGGSLWTAWYNCMTPGRFTPLPAPADLQADIERSLTAAFR